MRKNVQDLPKSVEGQIVLKTNCNFVEASTFADLQGEKRQITVRLKLYLRLSEMNFLH